MKILYLSAWFPSPPDNGARMRTFNLLRQLTRRHEVSLLSFVRGRGQVDQRDLDVLASFCRLLGTVPYAVSAPSRSQAILRLLSPQPRSLLENHQPQMTVLVREALQGNGFDLLIASEIGPGLDVLPYVLKLSIPCVIEDLELSMLWNKIPAQDSRTGQARHRLTWWKHRRYIARVLRRVQGCTVASTQERDLLRNIAPDFEPLVVVPNGLDLTLYEGDWGDLAPDTLVFPGALSYRANFDAMAFFLESVFPLVRARRPGVILRITGRTDGAPLHRLPACDGLVFTGYLEDVRPAIAQSAVCVVPLLTGGGTRLKILEAMALGTPVVATSRGAEGLDVTPGHDILIADDPGQFADAVLGLLDDPMLRQKLAFNGRRLVESLYDWQNIGDRLNEIIEAVAGM